jgi:hypothetical protein
MQHWLPFLRCLIYRYSTLFKVEKTSLLAYPLLFTVALFLTLNKAFNVVEFSNINTRLLIYMR